MNYDIADSSLAGEGHRRIAWAGRRMPVLAAIRERFEVGSSAEAEETRPTGASQRTPM